MDEVALAWADGFVFLYVFREEHVKRLLGFAGEQGPGGGEAVAEGVHGGHGFAFGCSGASGFGAVEAGALGVFLRGVFRYWFFFGFWGAGGQAVLVGGFL